MKTYLLIALSGAALLSAVQVNGSSAQTGNPPPAMQSDAKPVPNAQADRNGPTDNQIANDVDAKIARLKAELRLTPDQEKNWPGLETALHDYGIDQFKMMIAGRSARQDRDERPNDIAMIRSEADQLTSRAASLKKLADAADPIYGGLDDHQRRRLVQFMGKELETR
jgi:hypothetical protein